MPDKPRKLKDWVILGWDLLWDWKQLKPHLTDELHHAAKFPLVLVCAIIFAIFGCYFVTSHFANKKLESTRSAYQSTNSFLAGQLNATTTELGNLKNEYSQKIVEHANVVADLKTDYNEKLRDKDSQILKLANERDNALMRERQLESLPDTAILTYSNANMISKLALHNLDFEPQINGKNLTNYSVGNYILIPLEKNRSIAISLPNLGENASSIEKLTVDLSSPLDPTNLVSGIADGWWKPVLGMNGFLTTNGCQLETVANYTITSIRGWSATPLVVSTNLQNKWFPAKIDFYAPGLNGVKSYVVNFIFQ
jgi:hypothetical protein